MKTIAILLLILSHFTLSYGKVSNTGKHLPVTKSDTINNQEPIIVSVINLIATPEKYDGKKVTVIGYLTIYFESSALYLHKEDAAKAITKNAIWADISRTSMDSLKTYNEQYVIIEGIFNSHSNGHMAAYSGTIKNITRFDLWPPDTDASIKKHKEIIHRKN